MNALSIAWKLRVDMLSVMAAITALQANAGSESRLMKPRRVKEFRMKSGIRALLGHEQRVEQDERAGADSKVVDG